MNRTLTLTAAALLAFGIGAAHAGEGNNDPAGSPDATFVVGAAQTSNVVVTAGGTLPSNGSRGLVQTANSAPLGFEAGTALEPNTRVVARDFSGRAIGAAPVMANR